MEHRFPARKVVRIKHHNHNNHQVNNSHYNGHHKYNYHQLSSIIIIINNRPGCITIFKRLVVLLGSWPGHCLPFNTRRGCNLGPRAGLHMGRGGQNPVDVQWFIVVPSVLRHFVLRKWDEHGINTETRMIWTEETSDTDSKWHISGHPHSWRGFMKHPRHRVDSG